ncbi:Hypothetical predicted protein [Olea europaea subsp. europaea]|uniref:Uncharacterized protein n=1 Tax=Olea europaea subsp. europaea TaxID=158383 RepID=A0A8S0R1C7_OLEEU|nr:Hypothetical predicted protein [Olea europaea subsp. europaea]
MSNKIYSHGNIPFSWENKPGVSKVKQQDDNSQMDPQPHAPPPTPLPPPPMQLPENSRASIRHDMKVPLPPCAFQSVPVRSSSRRGLKKIDDPFLMAYKECTKSSKNDKILTRSIRENQGFGLKKNMSIFSCMSCSVIENNIVQPSKLLVSRSMREKERNRERGKGSNLDS